MSHKEDHWFTDKHGNRIKRLELVNKILKCIGNQRKCCKQIANEIGFEYQVVRNILRRLLTANLLDSTPTI
jgi:predicted transcriptional regulator